MAKSWQEKLSNDKDLPKVVKFDKENSKKNRPEGSYAIPRPREVDELMKKVPKGKLITINEMRQAFAKKYKADYGCPITCGIFSWIAAHAADENEQNGKKRITPYWRTLKTGGELNEKYPGGIENLKSRLEAEGHKVVLKPRSKKRYIVEDYQRQLADVF